MSDHPYTRRAFLHGGLTLVSTAATAPWFLQRSAFGIENPFDYRATARRPGVADDRILVVVQLSGGNDGLNTVVPFGDGAYYKARPALGVAEADVLKLDRSGPIGLHPSLAPLKDLYDDGLVGIVHGVGYPNPNRSHFKSMDIWHTADPERGGRGYGWIGRYFDAECDGEPRPDLCVAMGDQAPLATRGRSFQPISFQDERLFRWSGAELDDRIARSYDRINRAGVIDDVDEASPAGFIMRTALDAQVSSDRIRAAMRARPLVSYPGNGLGESLKQIALMIRAGLPTRVYYASLGGFDTHAGQPYRHAQLLRQYAEAVSAFQRDIRQQGNASRVVTATFSEFGRRVKQNASQGTDHGTAGAMVVMGEPIRGGLHGRHPSLTQLDSGGDLVHTTDFRSVYATLLKDWLTADPAPVLGRRYPTLPLIRS